MQKAAAYDTHCTSHLIRANQTNSTAAGTHNTYLLPPPPLSFCNTAPQRATATNTMSMEASKDIAAGNGAVAAEGAAAAAPTMQPERRHKVMSGFDCGKDYFSSLPKTPSLLVKRAAYIRSAEEQLADKAAAKGDMKQVLNWFHVAALGTGAGGAEGLSDVDAESQVVLPEAPHLSNEAHEQPDSCHTHPRCTNDGCCRHDCRRRHLRVHWRRRAVAGRAGGCAFLPGGRHLSAAVSLVLLRICGRVSAVWWRVSVCLLLGAEGVVGVGVGARQAKPTCPSIAPKFITCVAAPPLPCLPPTSCSHSQIQLHQHELGECLRG